MLRQFAGQLLSAPSAAVLLLLTSRASRGVIDSLRPENQGLRLMKGGARCVAAWKAALVVASVLCTRCTVGDSLGGGNASAKLQTQYISRVQRECVIMVCAWQHQHALLCCAGTYAVASTQVQLLSYCCWSHVKACMWQVCSCCVVRACFAHSALPCRVLGNDS
jgi:hypothetical protein